MNAGLLFFYVALRLGDIAWSGKLRYLGANFYTGLFLVELALFLAPAVLFLVPRGAGEPRPALRRGAARGARRAPPTAWTRT